MSKTAICSYTDWLSNKMPAIFLWLGTKYGTKEKHTLDKAREPENRLNKENPYRIVYLCMNHINLVHKA